MSCCCGDSKYHPETASDFLLVSVTVPSGCKPGQTLEVIAPDSSGRVAKATIPPECNYEGSTFMVRFPNNESMPATAKKQAQVAEVVSQKEELKICVQVPNGARVGSMMYAPVPGDSNRVLPVRIPSRKIRKFYQCYTMEGTILRSDIPGGKSGQKQNWHDNRVAVMAPLFF